MPNRDKLRIDEIMMLLCPIYVPVMVYYFGGWLAGLLLCIAALAIVYYIVFMLILIGSDIYEGIKTIIQKIKTQDERMLKNDNT